jgi:hypothetical protein
VSILSFPAVGSFDARVESAGGRNCAPSRLRRFGETAFTRLAGRFAFAWLA